MEKKALVLSYTLLQKHPWRMLALRRSSAVSSVVNSSILRSLKDHFLDATKVTPPPQKMKPPEPFSVVKEATTDGRSPVLRRSFGNGEEITVSVERLRSIRGGGDEGDDLGELLVRVEVSKAAEEESLHFLCELYSDALGIDTVFMAPKNGAPSLASTTAYGGPAFRDLDEKTREMFYEYLEERGVSENLFPFLQVWLCVSHHRKHLHWLKSVATFIQHNKPSEVA